MRLSLSVCDCRVLAMAMECEGSFTLGRANGAAHTWPSISPRITVTNTNLELLEQIKVLATVGRIIPHRRETPKWKETHQFYVGSDDGRWLAGQLLPYLGKKRRVAQILIELWDLRRPGRREAVGIVLAAKRELLIQELHGCNKRGMAA